MNKKAFTLVELLLVLVIIGIIAIIATNGIMEALEDNRVESAKATEKMMLYNIKLYNIDTEEDYWCTDSADMDLTQCIASGNRTITIEELLNTNRDINLGECLIKPGTMVVNRSNQGIYTYNIKILCSKYILTDKKEKTKKYSDDGYILTHRPSDEDSIYYETK